MSTTETTTTPKLEWRSVDWYTGQTDQTFNRVERGAILALRTSEARGYETSRCVRILTDPITRTTWHRAVDGSIFWRPEWLEFQLAFGEMVFNHAKASFPQRRAPEWKVYPNFFEEPRPRMPAALIWRIEHDHHNSVATVWWGKPGQDPAEFKAEVLAKLPEPLSRDERFALRNNVPVKVLVAAEPSPERAKLVTDLSELQSRVQVTTSDTAVQTLGSLNGIDVVVVADYLRNKGKSDKFEPTWGFGFIPEQLRALRPCIGFPVEARRKYEDGSDIHGLGYVMMHLRANCGLVIGGEPEPTRHVIDLVLDAVGLPKTK